ncbi:hypothetical protein BGZ68_001505 [Mortierella alpina]|nr:hypothetical protein BGZ68_001505 [Mortierella alpina]
MSLSSDQDLLCDLTMSIELLEDFEKCAHQRTPQHEEPLSTSRAGRVIIAGAGIGGLFLAILLERIGIPYLLLERAPRVKPLGSALALGPNILPVFEQLGLTSLLASISLPCPILNIYDPSLKKMGSFKMKKQTELTGYEGLICSRPNLYELLLSQIQPHNLILGKKILSYEENEFGVSVCCSDNTVYSGDILVGADGAYSRVRKNMFKKLRKRGLISKTQQTESPVPCSVCWLGVAKSQDPEKYECLKEPFVNYSTVVGGNGLGWNVINIPDDEICWIFWKQLDISKVSEERYFQNAEWASSNDDGIMQWFQEAPCPYGGAMGDLIKATPPGLISKVYLQEQIFDTWHHGRCVLIGDACHIMLPGAGQGAMSAMQDAVVLANCLFEMKELTTPIISAAFQEYQSQRFRHARTQFVKSRLMTKLLAGQSLIQRSQFQSSSLLD